MPSAAPSPSAAPTSGIVLHGAPGPVPVALDPMESFATDFPQGLVIAFDSVWTANEFVDTVTRIDPASGDVTEIKTTPGLGPQRIVAAGDSIWTSGAGSVDRIDPATNSVSSHIDAGSVVTSLAFAYGSLWAGGHDGLVRINPDTGEIEETIESSNDTELPDNQGCGVSEVVGSLWLTCGSTLDRIDPDTGEIVATTRAGGGGLLSDGENLWLTTGEDPFGVASPELASTTLDRIDPKTNEIIPGTTIEFVQGASVTSPLADGDVIWLPTSFGEGPGVGMLYEFDAGSGKVLKAFDISEGKGYGSNALGFGFGSMWTASGTANQVRRFQIPPH
jgi:glutamine cyclotransferase